jgi:hypothetical protein
MRGGVMLAVICASRATAPGEGGTAGGGFVGIVGIVAGATSPFEGDPFWDPVDFSWPLLAILGALCLLLTIGFVVWLVVQPEEPEHDTAPLVEKAARQDRRTAVTIRRRLDADTGRADTSEPDLR